MATARHTTILAFDFIINTLLTIIEVAAGLLSGSTALLADSIQNLTDSIVLTIAFLCERLIAGRRLSRRGKSHLYKVAGSLNAAILIALSLYIGTAAFFRVLHPRPIDAGLVIIVGLLSVGINWVAAGVLYGQRQHKTIRAPYIGLIFSGFSGVGVLSSGLATQFLHFDHIDGLVGMAIACTLLIRSTSLLVKTLHEA